MWPPVKMSLTPLALDDLQNNEIAFRKLKVVTENVEGKNYLIPMAWTLPVTKCACSVIKKWHTITEDHVDVKNTNDYLLHPFCFGFTKKMQQLDSEDLLCSASTGLPNPKEDDGNHDLRVADKLLERSCK